MQQEILMKTVRPKKTRPGERGVPCNHQMAMAHLSKHLFSTGFATNC
jgi:hypothetical protein